jgi:Domain of unknown function (DUF4878)
MRKLVVLACILSLFIPIVVLVGCGSGSSAQTPQQVTLAYFDTLSKKDANGSWNALSVESQKKVGTKSDWETALKQVLTKDKYIAQVTTGKTTINGNTATVEVTGTVDGKATTESIPLIKENGVWKIDATKT